MQRRGMLIAASALLCCLGCSYRLPHDPDALPYAQGEIPPAIYNKPLHVFAAWLRGRLPRSMDYGPDSRMTQRMVRSVGVRRVRDSVRAWMSSVCTQGCQPGTTSSRSFGPALRIWTAFDIPFHWNWTEQAVGSYSTCAQATATVTECGNKGHENCQVIKARILFHVVNVMCKKSFYYHLPWVKDKQTPGPMRDFTMSFRWTEELSLHCCERGAR